jgi:hypothetical protein
LIELMGALPEWESGSGGGTVDSLAGPQCAPPQGNGKPSGRCHWARHGHGRPGTSGS